MIEAAGIVRRVPIICHIRDRKTAIGKGGDGGLRITIVVVFGNRDLTTQLASITIEDLGSNVAVASIIPGGDELAVGKRHHGNVVLGAARGRVELELISRHGDSSIAFGITRCEDLAKHAPSAGIGARTAGIGRLIAPCDDEPAVVKSGYVRIVLATALVGVDHELIAESIAVGAVKLSTNIVAGTAVVAATIMPGNDETAVIERRHRRMYLITGRIGVDPELGAGRCAVGIITLTIDTVVGAPCILVTRMPGDDKAAVGQTGHVGIFLDVIGIAVDQDLRTLGNAAGIIELAKDIRAVAAT